MEVKFALKFANQMLRQIKNIYYKKRKFVSLN